MGIPKFFRFMSERYPLISQLIEDNKIPEFDNLYLDMNGIIHNCSHPNDSDASFRITETQIFLGIFSYIEHLFYKIKPKKVFFLAIDGVAPRAKMNQQRSRRFRTAKEAKEIREKAERRGEELPEEEAFDSNCITPGTPFMARLSEQLKYFIAKKITEDADWRNVQVVLSGHETPGEGEHKIMEYIRLCKAQPDYNPNVRHCLYGLDADLIMLGLLSHDPHFCLLREEVNFGPARKKAKSSLEHQNFFLLHLSVFREYLDMEFQELRSTLPFPYEFEKIIDDFILLNIFVGNDFLPHLPGLHINEGALDLLFNIYKKVLPVAGGYLNESGVLRTDRLQLILAELTRFEAENFEKEHADVSWYKGKQEKHLKSIEAAKAKGRLVITKTQRQLFDRVHEFIMAKRLDPAGAASELHLAADLPAKDRRFLEDLASSLKLRISFNKTGTQDTVTDKPRISLAFPVLDDETDDDDDNDDDDDDDNDDDNEDQTEETGGSTSEEQRKNIQRRPSEADVAVDRVLHRYLKAKVDDYEDDGSNGDEELQKKLDEKMRTWKKDYYREKLSIDFDSADDMHKIAYRYIEGLQWVLHYYYDGVASWSWFYDYHYAPKISDLKDVGEMSFSYELGTPFRPFDQLMGVLPSLSNQHIPAAFRDLMTDPTSPIIDFYPQNFEADLNGKKQDWEAVVKIPFIDEKRLLEALNKREVFLSLDEQRRNAFGPSKQFTYDEDEEHFHPSSLPGTFPDIVHSRAKIVDFDLPTLDGLHLVKGLTDGVELGARALAGFPSVKTLPHYARLGHHGVNVFQSESKGVSVVITVENTYEDSKTQDVAEALVGQRVFVNWPFLTEALVVGVSDNLFRYEMGLVGGARKVVANPHKPEAISVFHRKAEKIEYHYSKRFGVLIGDVNVLVHVRPLKGLKRLDDGAFVKDYQDDPAKETEQALQLAVVDVVQEDTRFLESPAKPIREEFPDKSKVFFLDLKAYGSPAHVVGSTESSLAIEVAFFPNQAKENAMLRHLVATRARSQYLPSYQVAKRVGISSLALSKLTSSMLLYHKDQKTNVGLNLKFEAKAQKVLGYSRKTASGWVFSDKAIDLIKEYIERFPELCDCLTKKSGQDITKASQIWPEDQVAERLTALKQWIKQSGVRDLEAVPLFAEQLSKDTVQQVEQFTAKLADTRTALGAAGQVKRVFIKGIPRTALLKPSHAPFRLQAQKFELGDRVIVVADSGNVPLSARGVVIGIHTSHIDVVFDVPFLSGTTLGDRCSPYRGGTVSFTSVLNLSQPQFVCSGAAGGPAASSSALAGDALERTLGPMAAGGFGDGAHAGSNATARGRGGGGIQHAGSYRPPNAFTPNPAAQRGGRAGAHGGPGVHILQRPARNGATVRGDFAFSGVASGQHRPTKEAAAAAAAAAKQSASINPLLAALNINGQGNVASNGTVGGPFRGASSSPRGRGAPRGHFRGAPPNFAGAGAIGGRPFNAPAAATGSAQSAAAGAAGAASGRGRGDAGSRGGRGGRGRGGVGRGGPRGGAPAAHPGAARPAAM